MYYFKHGTKVGKDSIAERGASLVVEALTRTQERSWVQVSSGVGGWGEIFVIIGVKGKDLDLPFFFKKERKGDSITGNWFLGKGISRNQSIYFFQLIVKISNIFIQFPTFFIAHLVLTPTPTPTKSKQIKNINPPTQAHIYLYT